MPKAETEQIELLKRQAAGIAAQLPTNAQDALRVLDYASEIIRMLGGAWGGASQRSADVVPMRLVPRDNPE